VIICPNRLYFDDYSVLRDVAGDAFGPQHQLIPPSDASAVEHDGRKVVALGHRFGAEVRIPGPRTAGRGRTVVFSTDWMLVRISATRHIAEFVGVEVQSIDTTGNYRDCRRGYMAGDADPPFSRHGLNWENVHKRILPQLIFKGHVLHREPLCRKGLYFVAPDQVYARIVDRLAGEPSEYPPGPGNITFVRYALAPTARAGEIRAVELVGSRRTTVVEVSDRFSSRRDLPPAGVVADRIRATLGLS
jgi:hypothetical protein